MYENPTIDQFKAFFVRDFPYGTDPATSILDSDIGNAYMQTNINFNEDFWADQNAYNIGYLLLSAHFLVQSIQGSSQGIFSQYDWSPNSKSVGSVSASYTIPQRILDNPEYAWLSTTSYGVRYLMLILPQLTGQMFNVFGTTLP